LSREISRKELLRGVFSIFRDARERVAGATSGSGSSVRVNPPGALQPDAAYFAACTGCEACVKACPYDCIAMTNIGDEPRRVAVIYPERKPCRVCSDLPCVAACKDGALVHPGSTRQVHMGVAQVDPGRCRTFRGERCDLCVKYCPFPDEAIRLMGTRPVVMASACTGCGICATVCPDRAILIVPERDLVPGPRVPRDLRAALKLRG
jgi:ferredoxin-type protein NapG